MPTVHILMMIATWAVIGFLVGRATKKSEPAKEAPKQKMIEVISVNGKEVAVVHVAVEGMTNDQRRDYFDMLKSGAEKIEGFNVWMFPHFKD